MKISYLVIYLLCLPTFASASIGCLDNSWHLTQKYDAKEYHPVGCTCPCEKAYKISADRGKCSRCEHYRDPQPFIIISDSSVAGNTRAAFNPQALKKAILTKKRP